MSVLLDLSACLAGCLVPLPLQQQLPPDGGGGTLIVQRANPSFGTQQASTQSEAFSYTVYVQSDGPNVSGRLCVQVNETCCLLQPDNVNVTHCLDDANVTPMGSQQYEVSFPEATPCRENLAASVVYVVPVLTTAGFASSDGGGIDATGLGTVDESHYWTVNCP